MDDENLLDLAGLDNVCLFVERELSVKQRFAKKYDVIVKVPAEIDHALFEEAQVYFNNKLRSSSKISEMPTTVYATLINGQDYLANKKIEVVNARIGIGVLLVYELNGVMPIKHDSAKIFKK